MNRKMLGIALVALGALVCSCAAAAFFGWQAGAFAAAMISAVALAFAGVWVLTE